MKMIRIVTTSYLGLGVILAIRRFTKEQILLASDRNVNKDSRTRSKLSRTRTESQGLDPQGEGPRTGSRTEINDVWLSQHLSWTKHNL